MCPSVLYDVTSDAVCRDSHAVYMMLCFIMIMCVCLKSADH